MEISEYIPQYCKSHCQQLSQNSPNTGTENTHPWVGNQIRESNTNANCVTGKYLSSKDTPPDGWEINVNPGIILINAGQWKDGQKKYSSLFASGMNARHARFKLSCSECIIYWKLLSLNWLYQTSRQISEVSWMILQNTDMRLQIYLCMRLYCFILFYVLFYFFVCVHVCDNPTYEYIFT